MPGRRGDRRQVAATAAMCAQYTSPATCGYWRPDVPLEACSQERYGPIRKGKCTNKGVKDNKDSGRCDSLRQLNARPESVMKVQKLAFTLCTY